MRRAKWPWFLLGRQGATELSLIMEMFLLLLPLPSPLAALPSPPGWPRLLRGPMDASLGGTLQRMQRYLAAAPMWVEKEKTACMWSLLHFPVDLLCPQVQPAPLARKQAFLISLGEPGPTHAGDKGSSPKPHWLWVPTPALSWPRDAAPHPTTRQGRPQRDSSLLLAPRYYTWGSQALLSSPERADISLGFAH